MVDIQEAIKLYNSGLTYEELATRYKCTKQNMQSRIGHLVDRNRPKKLKPLKRNFCDCGKIINRSSTKCSKCMSKTYWKWDWNLVAYLYNNGASSNQICDIFGRKDPGNLINRLKRHGVVIRPRGQRSILSMNDVKQLVKLYHGDAKSK